MRLLLLLLSPCALVFAARTPNFTQCIINLQTGSFGWEVAGAVNSSGIQVANASDASGLTYNVCKGLCGSGPETFNWRVFSLQFTSWFLPWLPLMSQLPYGSKDALSNFSALLLMVGSPALAAYSLALAVIGNRWMVKRLMRNTSYRTFLAAQALGNLQQVSIRLPGDEHVLPSLIALRENSTWWRTLVDELDYSVPRWTVAAIMSVLYLLLADTFSWASILGNDYTGLQVNSTGESVGSLWLCLLPIVICYLQISPKSDFDRIGKALEQANKCFYVAADRGEPEQGQVAHKIRVEKVTMNVIHEDMTFSAPVLFYARFFTWIRVSREITDGFYAVSQHEIDGSAEDGNITRSKIIDYCKPRDGHQSRHSYEIFSIFFRSAFLALFLQWGTTGAALVSIYFTPTKGFGCRSMYFLFYGLLATLVWLFCVISSILSHSYDSSPKGGKTTNIIYGLSIVFRHLAKTLAAINTVCLFLTSLLQFANFFDTCYCNASVIGLGKNAYTVLQFTKDDASAVKLAWAGGLIMSSSTAILFTLAINLLRKHPEWRPSSFEMLDIQAH
ncbi:hypothetical protein AX15_007500 [Amanita polypyramis BW_CC]|nr:hypothetical protein AX15_007500 [Amanita polypyramis BW_CC]